MKSILAFTLGIMICMTTKAADRFPMLTPDQLDPEQRKMVEALIAGGRGGGAEPTPEAIAAMLKRGPFNAWMRSPQLGAKMQAVGDQVRFHSSLPLRLNEFAILITARHWTSQYEWYAHHILAMKAGLDPKIAADLAEGRRPKGMTDDEAAVYDFCTELHRDRKVGDKAYKRAVQLFGEKGVVDLIGVSGYYTLVSMSLNVAEVQVPPGQPVPLKPLKKVLAP